MKLPAIQSQKSTLMRKLFLYMFIFALILLMLFFTGMFLIGGFSGTRSKLADTLRYQCEVFEQQIDTHYDNLAVLSIQLSEVTTDMIENYLSANRLTFTDLNGSEEHIHELQESMIDTLTRKLWEADCTGAFIMLDAQVNPSAGNSSSRTGLYLQRNSLDRNDSRVLLYRGLSDIGKFHNCMPHRKWRLEFSTDTFPNYEELKTEVSLPLETAYRVTDVTILPGTDQHVMLMTIPIFSSNGTFYGFCGFEISEGYFRNCFSQPSELSHAIFCLGRRSETTRNADVLLSTGVTGMAYRKPTGIFKASNFGNGLKKWTGTDMDYVGIAKEIVLCPGDGVSTISVLISSDDYQHILAGDTVRIILLITCFTSAAAAFSLFFVRRYLKPIREGIRQLKAEQYHTGETGIDEIDDLFAFFAQKEQERNEQITFWHEKHNVLQDSLDKLQDEHEHTKRELDRIADEAHRGLDSDSYQLFTEQLTKLTPREHEVFNLYVEGKASKEIMEIMGITINGLKWHNKNIYMKLGVPSRKELLRYAAIMKQKQAQ